jgi:hypothetical protein
LLSLAVGVRIYRLGRKGKAKEQANQTTQQPRQATEPTPQEPTQITIYSSEQHDAREEVPSPHLAIALPIPDAMVTSEVPESKVSFASP